MTLAAELVAMIKINLVPLLIGEKITIFLVMARYTDQGIYRLTMFNLDISMGKEAAIGDPRGLLTVADAAAISGDEILPGQYPEGPTLIGLFGQDTLHR